MPLDRIFPTELAPLVDQIKRKRIPTATHARSLATCGLFSATNLKTKQQAFVSTDEQGTSRRGINSKSVSSIDEQPHSQKNISTQNKSQIERDEGTKGDETARPNQISPSNELEKWIASEAPSASRRTKRGRENG
jgi:hypothetical protein